MQKRVQCISYIGHEQLRECGTLCGCTNPTGEDGNGVSTVSQPNSHKITAEGRPGKFTFTPK